MEITLTPDQRKVLDAGCYLAEKYGRSPRFAEIVDRTKMSTNKVTACLDVLEAVGNLTREPGKLGTYQFTPLKAARKAAK